MADFRATTMGGLLAACAALLLLLGSSLAHAMPVRCGSGPSVVATEHHREHREKMDHATHEYACCTVACGLCLAVQPHMASAEPGLIPIGAPASPLLPELSGQAPAPDPGPPRPSA